MARPRQVSDEKLSEIKIAPKRDTVLQEIIHFTLNRWTHEVEKIKGIMYCHFMAIYYGFLTELSYLKKLNQRY